MEWTAMDCLESMQLKFCTVVSGPTPVRGTQVPLKAGGWFDNGRGAKPPPHYPWLGGCNWGAHIPKATLEAWLIEARDNWI